MRLADFFDTKRLAVTKWVMVKETCFSRSRLLVVEPHSRSTVPFAISGIRVADVTGCSHIEFGELEVRLHRVNDLVAEVHGVADDLLLVVVIGENGTDDSRWPTVIVPVSLIFFSVPSCANAVPASRPVAAIVMIIVFKRIETSVKSVLIQ